MRARSFLFPAAALVAVVGSGCKRRTEAPAWLSAMPAPTRVVLTCDLAYALEHPMVQDSLGRVPQASQMLELFLQKARFNPRKDQARFALYVMDPPPGPAGGQAWNASFLIRLSGFKDPKALQAAVGESFPPEGFLRTRTGEWPLYTVMDVQKGNLNLRLRVAADPSGTLWLGDLAALEGLARPATLSPEALKAAAWTSPGRTLQGAVRPQGLVEAFGKTLPDSLAQDLPLNLDILLWEATPGGEGKPWELGLVAGGSPEAVAKAVPWLQRFGAAMDATRAPGQAPAQFLQERNRAALRTTMEASQVEGVLKRLVPMPIQKS